MSPDFHRNNPERYVLLRALLNDQLLLCGLRLNEEGDFSETRDLANEQVGLIGFIFRLIGFTASME